MQCGSKSSQALRKIRFKVWPRRDEIHACWALLPAMKKGKVEILMDRSYGMPISLQTATRATTIAVNPRRPLLYTRWRTFREVWIFSCVLLPEPGRGLFALRFYAEGMWSRLGNFMQILQNARANKFHFARLTEFKGDSRSAKRKDIDTRPVQLTHERRRRSTIAVR